MRTRAQPAPGLVRLHGLDDAHRCGDDWGRVPPRRLRLAGDAARVVADARTRACLDAAAVLDLERRAEVPADLHAGDDGLLHARHRRGARRSLPRRGRDAAAVAGDGLRRRLGRRRDAALKVNERPAGAFRFRAGAAIDADATGVVSYVPRRQFMTAVKEWPSSFSPAQYEVVNMVSCLKRESDVVALKSILVGFINERLQDELDRLYEDGTLSDEKMSELAGQHLRTPYGA